MKSYDDDYNEWLKKNNKTQVVSNTVSETSTSSKMKSYEDDYNQWLERKNERARKQQEESQRQQKERSKQEEQQKAREQELKRLNEQAKANMPSVVKDKIDKLSSGNLTKNEELKLKTELNNDRQTKTTQKLVKETDGILSTENAKEIILSDIQAEEKAEKRAKEINEAVEDGDYLSVFGYWLEGLPEGMKSGIAGIGEFGLNTIASDLDRYGKWFGNEELLTARNKLIDKSQDLKGQTSYYKKTNSKINNDIVRTGGNVSNTISEMIPSIAANAVLPGSGVFVTGAQVAGQESTDEINVNRDNLDKAMLTGAAKGTAAGMTEKIVGGDFISKGLADKLATKGISRVTTNKFAQKLLWKSYQVGGEVLEENVEDSIDDIIDAVINGKDLPSLEEKLNQIGETSKITGLSTIVLNALGLGGGDFDTAVKETQMSDLNNDIKKLDKQISNEKDTSKIEELNQEYDWKQKQLDALTLPTARIHPEINYINNNEAVSNVVPKTDNSLLNETASNKSITPLNKEVKTERKNIINEKVNKYIGNIKGDFKSDINIDTKVLNTPDNLITNYKNAKEFALYDRAKKIFSTIHKKVFKNNNQNIYVNNTDIKESINNTIKEENQRNKMKENIAVFSQLDKIIENGELISSEEFDNKGRDEYSNYEYYVSKAYIDGQPYIVEFDTRLQNGSSGKPERHFRLERVYNINEVDSVTGTDKSMSQFVRESTSNNIIPSSTEEVNTTNNYMQNEENNTQKVSTDNIEKPTRHEIIQKNRELARENIKNISNWKDKKNGLSYQLETMERNMYDIIPDKTEAKQVIDTYFEPVHSEEANKQRFLNNYNNRIRELKLNNYESEAVQFLGEKKYNPDFTKGDGESLNLRNEIQKRIDNNIKKGKIDIDKVNNAIEIFRNSYDELFELENQKLRENGYQEKAYRKGYFPHFIDYVPETRTQKVLDKLGFKIDKRPLPTDIAGITEQFVPGKTWNKSALQRKTNKTDYNALKGFDTYIQQAADNIFHTENIQRLRGLENEIRYQYSDKGIQERIDNILNDETLFEEEKQDLIDNIFTQSENPLPNLVTELRRYTNALANKKSEADRSIENKIGRSVYSTVNAIENRFAANAVGLNIGSAITNFIPITQAYSQVSTKNMNRAIIDTVKSQIKNDGFVDKSAFLTSRLNQSDKLYKATLEKFSDKANIVFKGIDEIASNIVVRGKYLDNIEKGMPETEAIKDADQFARKVMADRSKGSLPTIFEEKNPATKLFTQFQLEVNNQYRYMFKDIPRDLRDKGLGAIALAFFKMFAAAWIYNEANEKITGRRPAFDPIDIVKSSYETIIDNNTSNYNKALKVGKEITEDLPFVGGFVGGGRVPINGALPSFSNLSKSTIGLITGEMNSKKALSNIGKEVAKPLYYLAPPFGGGQIKKSIEGINTVANKGSYGVDNQGRDTLQFPVENASTKDYIKAGMFGKYALPTAKEYSKRGYKSLNANQTELYKNSNVPYTELLKYIDSDLKKNEDKINYIDKTNWTANQKWGVYTNDIFSKTERKDGGSQSSDAEYITSNGVSKSEYMKIYNNAIKNSIDMPKKDEYIEMKDNGLSLNTYVDYKIKVSNETAKQKKSGTISEDGQLKDKEKINILLNSSYSNKEKSAIYENYINSDDSRYQLLKATNIEINQYLKFKSQEFVSDKKDDGTVSGQAISGTKKKKIFNYLENTNMTYTQKLLLYGYGQDHKLSQNELKYVVNYVKGLNNKTNEEKREILSHFKGITIYKNGSIEY